MMDQVIELEKQSKHSIYYGIHGKPLDSVTLSPDKDLLTFIFQDGSTAQFFAAGDCCSESWIEHVEMPDSLLGESLVFVQVYNEESEDIDDGNVLLRIYKTVFVTDKGNTISIEYRNESNGYYGGYLERVTGKKKDFAELNLIVPRKKS